MGGSKEKSELFVMSNLEIIRIGGTSHSKVVSAAERLGF